MQSNSMIGKLVYPRDNTCMHSITNHNYNPELAGNSYSRYAEQVKIVSEPYELTVPYIKMIFDGSGYRTLTFITVEYKGQLYRMLNYYTEYRRELKPLDHLDGWY